MSDGEFTDPLLPAPLTAGYPLPGDADVRLAVPGGSARYRFSRVGEDEVTALWGGLEQHTLLPELDPGLPGPARARALGGLLRSWRAAVPEPPASGAPLGGADREATVRWPSRDTALTEAFLGHQLVPKAVLAVRPAGRAAPPPAAGVTVRQLTGADVDQATELRLESLRWDAQFGACVVRPGAADYFRDNFHARLARFPGWTWVAEDPGSGRLSGLLSADPPWHSEWIAPDTAARAPAYLALLAVTAGRRGRGVGGALVHAAHTALEAAGADAVLLHYGALNPLSAPFWHRCGYRPLWTTWSARWS